MKLCIISASFSGGGAEKVAINLANHYSKVGVDVHLLVLKDVGPYRGLVDAGVDLSVFGVGKTRQSFYRLIKFLRCKSFTHILSTIRDVNIVVGLAVIFNKNVKCIFREAAIVPLSSETFRIRKKVLLMLMKLVYRRANLVIANSPDTLESLLSSGVLFSPDKATVIGNPAVTGDLLEKAQVMVLHPWLSDPNLYVLVNVARLDLFKNQELLLKAFSKVANLRSHARLLFVGQGQEKDRLESLALSLGVSDKVEFVGFKVNPFPYIYNADLFVLTSRSEGFGNVIAESLACGIPVVSTECPGGPKMILDDGRYGTLVPNDDEDALCDAIVSNIDGVIYFNRESLMARGADFSVAQIATRYLEVMSSV